MLISNYPCNEYFQLRVTGANGVYYKSAGIAYRVKEDLSEVAMFILYDFRGLCVVITCKGKKTRMFYSFFNSL